MMLPPRAAIIGNLKVYWAFNRPDREVRDDGVHYHPGPWCFTCWEARR